MPAEAHPDELELMEVIDGTADAAVVQHVHSWPRCQSLTARAAAPRQPDAETRMPAAAVTTTILSALRRSLPDRVRRGQLWRTRWDDDTALAYVLHADPQVLRLVPLSLDVHLADHRTVILRDSPLGVPVGIWAGAEVSGSSAVLERYLGSCSPSVERDVRRLVTAPGTEDPLSDRAQFRSALHAELSTLNDAAQSSQPKAPSDDAALSDVLAQAGLGVRDLAELLQVDLATALDIYRADVAPTPEQMSSLEQALPGDGSAGLPARTHTRAAPEELATELASPEHKASILTAREPWRLNESEVRGLALERATDLALAARVAQRSQRDWAEIVERVLQ